MRVYALLATYMKPCDLHLLCRAGVLVAPQGTDWLSCTQCQCAQHKSCDTLDASADNLLKECATMQQCLAICQNAAGQPSQACS